MRHTLAILGWSAFLASSWTWCIGLFLPSLLLRDYHPAAFLLFAAPNVLGAAAMGCVLRPGASGRLVAAHAPAMQLFSLVTIAFQLFFLVWAASDLHRWLGADAPLRTPVAIVAAATAIAAAATARSRSTAPILALALALWLLAPTLLLAIRADPPPPLPHPPASFDLPPLALVCLFGFALCPYLDLTFHRARQVTARLAPAVFILAFVGLFTATLLASAAYAPFIAPQAPHAPPTPALALLLLAHITSQLVFTSAVHLKELARAPGRHTPTAQPMLWVILASVSLALGLSGHREAFVGNMTFGELVYRCFLGFYGLAFPAYVWMFMVPRGRPASIADRRLRLAFALSLGIAAPFFWMGFVLRQELWLIPGLAAVLAARLVPPSPATPAPPTQAPPCPPPVA